MLAIEQIKREQQEQHLKVLSEGSASQKAKMFLQNSGFASAIIKKRHLVSVQFGK